MAVNNQRRVFRPAPSVPIAEVAANALMDLAERYGNLRKTQPSGDPGPLSPTAPPPPNAHAHARGKG